MTTLANLDNAVEHLNAIAGRDIYRVLSAYGTHRLTQSVPVDGSCMRRDVSRRGTMSETLAFIHAYADGFVAAAAQIERINREAK